MKIFILLVFLVTACSFIMPGDSMIKLISEDPVSYVGKNVTITGHFSTAILSSGFVEMNMRSFADDAGHIVFVKPNQDTKMIIYTVHGELKQMNLCTCEVVPASKLGWADIWINPTPVDNCPTTEEQRCKVGTIREFYYVDANTISN